MDQKYSGKNPLASGIGTTATGGKVYTHDITLVHNKDYQEAECVTLPMTDRICHESSMYESIRSISTAMFI